MSQRGSFCIGKEKHALISGGDYVVRETKGKVSWAASLGGTSGGPKEGSINHPSLMPN